MNECILDGRHRDRRNHCHCAGAGGYCCLKAANGRVRRLSHNLRVMPSPGNFIVRFVIEQGPEANASGPCAV